MPRTLLRLALIALTGAGLYFVLPIVPALVAMEWGCRL